MRASMATMATVKRTNYVTHFPELDFAKSLKIIIIQRH